MKALNTALFAACALSLNLACAADLTVHIDDIKSADGTIMIAVYNSEGSFLKQPAKANGAPAATAGSVVVFKDLPEGEYAFAAYHDANGNGKMDKNILGIPTEDYAFSNNAMGKMGPPSFEKAKIALPAAGATVRVSFK